MKDKRTNELIKAYVDLGAIIAERITAEEMHGRPGPLNMVAHGIKQTIEIAMCDGAHDPHDESPSRNAAVATALITGSVGDENCLRAYQRYTGLDVKKVASICENFKAGWKAAMVAR